MFQGYLRARRLIGIKTITHIPAMKNEKRTIKGSCQIPQCNCKKYQKSNESDESTNILAQLIHDLIRKSNWGTWNNKLAQIIRKELQIVMFLGL